MNVSDHKIFNRCKVIFAACSWGTMGLFVRWIDLPTSVIAGVRGLIGALFLLNFLLFRNGGNFDFKAVKANFPILFLSGIALGVNWILLFESYRCTSLAISTLCYYMAPIAVMLLSCIFFREKMTAKGIVCIVFSLFGMVLISGVLNKNPGNGYGITGMLLALGAAVFYACVTMLGKETQGLDANTETIVKLFTAALILIPYNFMTVDFTILHPSVGMILLLIFLGIVHTGGAFAAYFSAIHALPMQEVAVLTYLDPVVAVLVSVVFLHEKTNPAEIIGAILLIATLSLYELSNSRNQ